MSMQCSFQYPLQPTPIITCPSEFQVNTDTLGDSYPTIAALNDGGFVVVWNDNTGTTKIHGQRYDSAGAVVGAEFQVNTDTLTIYDPTVVALNDGGFVVVWDDDSVGNIHGQRYDSTGGTVGVEFQVNTDTLYDGYPTIAALKDGGFVVVWNDNTGTKKIHGQRYDSAGAVVGAEFQVNTDTLNDSYPTIAAMKDGGFVVVWGDNTAPNKIHGQRYDSAGAVVGAEFQVNTDTLNDSRPTIAALNDGGFVVVWGDNTGTKKIHGQRYDSAGAPSDVTGKTVPSSTLLCDTPNSCVASNTIFDPTTQGTYTLSTQKIAPISDVLCTSGQVCASSGSPADHCVTTSYQCAAPANIFDSTTQGTYTLSTEKVVPISGSQVCTSSAPSSSNAWPAASIATTAVLGVSTVIGWGLCVYKYLSSASTAGQVLPAHLEDGQVSDGQMTDGRFVRESNVKTTNQIVVGTALQVALPVLILNLQMQVTNAAQTIDQAATWLTSLFDDEMLDVSEASYPYQEMYVDSQNFDFLSASNDTTPSYDYCNFG